MPWRGLPYCPMRCTLATVDERVPTAEATSGAAVTCRAMACLKVLIAEATCGSVLV